MSRNKGTIYSGLVSNNGCVFATNDISGAGEKDCAIVEVNKRCGALSVTTEIAQLKRFAGLWQRAGICHKFGNEHGLSYHLAETIANSFETEFKRDPGFVSNPLPFLLLLVGYPPGDSCLEHIFMRNRVVTSSQKEDKREYVTGFEIRPPVTARSLFYGHAELARYWARPLMESKLDSRDLSLLSYYSLTEIQKLDDSIAPGIRMASLSDRDGFIWIAEDEWQQLSSLAEEFDGSIREGLAESNIGSGTLKDTPPDIRR
jgi:hypothetical protein